MANSNAYMADYMARRREDRRAKLIEMLGGVCFDCRTDKDLQFDHRVPGSQTFRISGSALDKPWPVILAEAAKCDLRCDPCHRRKTSEFGENGEVDHGGGASGKKNCQCLPCKARKAEYMGAYGHPSRSPVAQLVVATPC